MRNLRLLSDLVRNENIVRNNLMRNRILKERIGKTKWEKFFYALPENLRKQIEENNFKEKDSEIEYETQMALMYSTKSYGD